MPLVDLTLPKMGESIMEATILHWLKKPGDHVQVDEGVLEIATDKVDSEVPSTVEGELEEILFGENDVVPVGAVLARIRTSESYSDGDGLDFEMAEEEELPDREVQTPVQENPSVVSDTGSTISSGTARFYSPLVLMIAQNEHISISELERITGTGHDGRVTKKDILVYIENKKRQHEPVSTNQTFQRQETSMERIAEMTSPMFASGNVEIIEMDRMRKLISDHMVMSKHTSAHVTSFTEADVTNLVKWRERVKMDFEKREGEKLTFTPLFMEAVVRSIKKFPLINSSVEGTRIVIKKDINLGMATALPNGNLIVPIIRNADMLNLVGLAKKVNYLANTARSNKLKPEDTQDGTFTLTNVGTFGSLMGTPIINQPQVAILAVGLIKKRPVVIETADGDSIAIRHMMYLSLSYDHRIIDGSLGSTFLTAVAHELEHFNTDREW